MRNLAIGTAQFGLDYGINNQKGIIPKKEILQILDLCFKSGIVHLDTSPLYGESENSIGACDKRRHFNITTKYSEKNSIKDSLNSLGVNQVYAYLVHQFESYKKNPSIWNEIKKSQDAGKVQKIGFSLYYPEQLEDLLNNTIDFNIVQVPYNIMDQRFAQYFKELKLREIEIQVRSVFLQGLVFKDCDCLEEKFDSLKDNLMKLNNICFKNSLSASSACIGFVSLNKYIDRIILGVNSLEELKNNLIYCNDLPKVKDVMASY